MFGQSFGGNQNGPGSFIDFMILNEVMNSDQKKQKSKKTEPKRNWIDKREALDAMEDKEK